MPQPETSPNTWEKILVWPAAIGAGLLIGLVAANVWPLLLSRLGMPVAAVCELFFLTVYVWWASGGGPPRAWKRFRAEAFRRTALTRKQWFWGILEAVFFAVTIHVAIVLLFRCIPFPRAAFHSQYDISFIHSQALRWLAVVISAQSAGVCEETGFRAYMQRPLEVSGNAPVAIAISSLLFAAVHITKNWALLGMFAITLGAGILLGLLAWVSQSLIPGIIGHTLRDISLFAYWWTGLAGTFSAGPIFQTGVDRPFIVTCVILFASLCIAMLAMAQLHETSAGLECC